MSARIDIRRDGEEWIIEDGSARIRFTKPGDDLIEHFVHQGEEKVVRREGANVPASKQPRGGAKATRNA